MFLMICMHFTYLYDFSQLQSIAHNCSPGVRGARENGDSASGWRCEDEYHVRGRVGKGC